MFKYDILYKMFHFEYYIALNVKFFAYKTHMPLNKIRPRTYCNTFNPKIEEIGLTTNLLESNPFERR